MSSWTYERYDTGWAAYSAVFDDWDDSQRFVTKRNAERAVENFMLSATETGRQVLSQRLANTFWDRARCIDTHQGTDNSLFRERAKYGKGLVRVRKWKDPETGETRKTVEIEVDD